MHGIEARMGSHLELAAAVGRGVTQSGAAYLASEPSFLAIRHRKRQKGRASWAVQMPIGKDEG
eukprot:1757192-Rhodomonas_salina.1